MDLNSAQHRASWHPLTSIIEFEGSWEDRDFHGIPFMVSEHPRIISTIHHELTHLASARTTRLGHLLAQTMASAIRSLKDESGKIAIPSHVETALAAYTPLLEGLAIYAQLDYMISNAEDPLPHPVPLHSSFCTIGGSHVTDRHRTLMLAREESICEQSKSTALLWLLFMDSSQPHCSYYLAGYLYLKATVALIARRCPQLASPSIALPLITRIWCDHPAIAQLVTGNLSVVELLSQINDYISQLTKRQLNGLASMLGSNSEAFINFDHWQIHSQIAENKFQKPIFSSQDDIQPFLNDAQDKDIEKIRSVASLHILSQTTGRLVPGDSGSDYKIIKDSGNIVKVKLLDVIKVWKRLYDNSDEDDRALIEKHLAIAIELQNGLLERLNGALNKKVTIANFMTFGSPPSFGIAVWSDKPGCNYLPYTWTTFENNKNIQLIIIDAALDISPAERVSLGKRLLLSKEYSLKQREATSQIYKWLVSDSSRQEAICEQRLSAVAFDSRFRDLSRWCMPDLDRTDEWKLADTTADWLTTVFDLPGFTLDQQEASIKFTELLPTLGPIPEFKL